MILHINADRFKEDFDSLAQIGSTGDGGVSRPALSDLHLEARRWFLARAAAAGLETHVDSAGNHSAILRSPLPHLHTERSRSAHTGTLSEAEVPTLLLGSHTDSVPNGGRFDGALGVLSALETLRSVKDAGVELPVHLEAIDFTDEEGTLVGLLGSAAIAGKLAADTLKNPRGGRERLTAGLARAGLTEDGLLSAKRDPQTLAGYLELHIEQGPRLLGSGIKIGVVSEIVGINSFRLVYRGKANHAGTTPMDARTDASLGASAFVLAAREMVMRDFPACVVNIGQMNFKPGAFNIIPGVAELALEFRSPETDELAKLESSLLTLAETAGEKYGLSLTAQPAGSCAPAPMSGKAQAAFVAAAESLGLSHVSMPSGAGHDGQSLADLTDVGMIFIPSRDGISHSPLEFSEWEDCVNGASVLLNAAVKMASGGV
mgnify:CR=1 FL=1